PIRWKESKGEDTWKFCKEQRQYAMMVEFFTIFSMLLWFFFPIKIFSGSIFKDYWISGIIFGILLIFGGFLVIKGWLDAGKETLSPSEDTKMYGGIYRKIRHPQSIGEFTMFIMGGFLLNSWFILLINVLFVVIYFPIMIHYEETDLIRRFGDSYRRYHKEVGLFWPKHHSFQNEEK
ncbi:MAG: methyltransferase family protein, partial [Promethearchaeota archaeon]